MNQGAIEDIIQAWAVANADAEVNEVILANQNGPRPERPYITFLITSDNQTEHADESEVNDDGEITITNDKTVIVSTQCFGENSKSIMDGLRNSLNKVSVKDGLRGSGLPYIRTLNGVTDLSQVVGSEFEERAGMDLEFRTTAEVIDEVGFIECVDGTATYETGNQEININYQIGE